VDGGGVAGALVVGVGGVPDPSAVVDPGPDAEWVQAARKATDAVAADHRIERRVGRIA
jgi:hypothetical protein